MDYQQYLPARERNAALIGDGHTYDRENIPAYVATNVAADGRVLLATVVENIAKGLNAHVEKVYRDIRRPPPLEPVVKVGNVGWRLILKDQGAVDITVINDQAASLPLAKMTVFAQYCVAVLCQCIGDVYGPAPSRQVPDAVNPNSLEALIRTAFAAFNAAADEDGRGQPINRDVLARELGASITRASRGPLLANINDQIITVRNFVLNVKNLPERMLVPASVAFAFWVMADILKEDANQNKALVNAALAALE